MPNAVDYNPFEKFGKDFNYDSIFDGRVWELEYGQDFECSTTTVRNKLQYHASLKGINVRIMIRKLRVFVQALNPQKVSQ